MMFPETGHESNRFVERPSLSRVRLADCKVPRRIGIINLSRVIRSPQASVTGYRIPARH